MRRRDPATFVLDMAVAIGGMPVEGPKKLIFRVGKKTKSLKLKEKKTLTVGNDKANMWTIVTDPSVSRFHCRIDWTPLKVPVITDMNSTNGTYVNGKRIDQVVLKPGDVIQVGETLNLLFWGKHRDIEKARGVC